jgi:hypothetical protein
VLPLAQRLRPVWERSQVASTPWDPQGEARAALRTIVADPQYGAAALSSSQTMTNLLKDLLPDAPREASVLVAASEACLADGLKNYLSQGMDLGTASRLVAGSFETRTALTPDACSWVVGALVGALRLDAAGPRPAPTSVPPGGDRLTRTPTGTPEGDRLSMTPVGTKAGVGTGRPDGLRLAAALVAAAGVLLVIWACALPYLDTPAGEGRRSFSLFNTGSPGGAWFALEPVGVAILGLAAAALLIFASRAARLRLIAAGTLVAFGTQTVFLFAGLAFGIQSPDHPGAAGAVGIIGGLLLLIAGVLGAVGRSAPAAAKPAAAG